MKRSIFFSVDYLKMCIFQDEKCPPLHIATSPESEDSSLSEIVLRHRPDSYHTCGGGNESLSGGKDDSIYQSIEQGYFIEVDK